jgi:hypothetical protein
VRAFVRDFAGSHYARFRRPLDSRNVLVAYATATELDFVSRHETLRRLRDTVYAHTDKASGRSVSVGVEVAGEVINVVWQEQWLPFPREVVPEVIEYLEHLRDEFRFDAAKIQLQLSFGHLLGTPFEEEPS